MLIILWDSTIKTDLMIPAKRADLGIVNKTTTTKKDHLPDFRLCRLGHWQRTKKVVVNEGGGNTSCNWYILNGPGGLGKGTGSVGNQRTSRDHFS